MIIQGAGGGGKGGAASTANAPKEAPNTLQSKNVVRVIDMISEGAISGIVGDDIRKGIFFNDIPLMDSVGNLNFQGVTVETTNGEPFGVQNYIQGFARAQSQFFLNTQVKYGIPITASLTGDYDAVRVIVGIPSLTKTDKSTGDLNGNSVQIKIEIQANASSTWIEKVNETISGKCVTNYERSYRINLDGTLVAGSPWTIRMTRISADDADSSSTSQTYFVAYTGINDSKLVYPDSALVAFTIDAAQFGTSIPTRSYRVKGRIIQVPSNYDPVNKTYTGIWDGTFSMAFTDNPAWILYDLITHARYGLGNVISPDMVDKWAFYTVGQYCDEKVPDGTGGTEARFRWHGVLQVQADAYTVLNNIAASMNAMIYWGAGTVTIVQDAPADPVKLVTPANVINGIFTYNGSSIKSRHSVAIVTWYNPDENYRPNVLMVEDADAIALIGYRKTDVTAMGCISRGQAYRLGKWIIDTENNQTEVVTYEAALDHADVRPGDIISVADPAYAGIRFGGRIVSATTTTVTVDSAVTIASGKTYELSVVLPDGTLGTSTVTNSPGSPTALTLSPALADTPLTGAVWILAASDVVPRQFRIIGVREHDKHYQVTALFHDPNKYDRIERNRQITPPPYSILPGGAPLPGGGISVQEYLYQTGTSAVTAITVSWLASTDPRVNSYQVQYQSPRDNGFRDILQNPVRGLSVDIEPTVPGIWNIRVRGLDGDGNPSQWVTFTTTLTALLVPIDDVTNFTNSVNGEVAYLSWDAVDSLALEMYRIRYASSSTAWENAADVVNSPGGSTAVLVPARPGYYLIKAITVEGLESVNAASTIISGVGTQTYNVVETLEFAPDFTGTFTNTEIYNDGLILSAGQLTGEWDSNPVVDLGAVFASRVTATITVTTTASSTSTRKFEDVPGNFDDQPGYFQAGGIGGNTNAAVYISTTNDDPSGSPVWSAFSAFSAGFYSCRAFKFALDLTSDNASVTPYVTEFSITVDMPDRVQSGTAIADPANIDEHGYTAVVFPSAFKAIPKIIITGVNLSTGDWFQLANQTSEGFDIGFFDSGSIGVVRSFNWVAHGYGQ